MPEAGSRRFHPAFVDHLWKTAEQLGVTAFDGTTTGPLTMDDHTFLSEAGIPSVPSTAPIAPPARPPSIGSQFKTLEHDLDEPIETYRANLGKVLDRFEAAAPAASCVLVGPVDFPEKDETGTWVPRPRLDQIIDAQKAVAKERGCGWFDTRAFMGGPGTMDAWVVAQLAKADHLHLSKLGYLQLGRVLADALMRDYDLAEPAAVTK